MRILLPIIWFVLNVLSFNTFSNSYEQKKSNETLKAASWNRIPSQSSSNKKNTIYFLPEEFEENVEGESDLNFVNGSDALDRIVKYSVTPELFAEYSFCNISCSIPPIAYPQVKFILFQNYRI